MFELSLPAALAVLVLWPAGIIYCTLKYLKSYRTGVKLDASIWFIAWCFIIAMVEWFALAVYDIVEFLLGR